MEKIVLIATVGTTAEPIQKAIEESIEDGEVSVYLLYGRPFPNQEHNPFDVALKIKQEAEQKGIKARVVEISEPEEFDKALQGISTILTEIKDTDIQRLVANFTGGTKAMSAALAHAALTEPISAEVVLDYTGGRVRDKNGRVIKDSMRTKRTKEGRAMRLCKEAYNQIEQANYSHASFLVEPLPNSGKFGFYKSMIRLLYEWDNFNYDEAYQLLTHQKLLDQYKVMHNVSDFKGILFPLDQYENPLKQLNSTSELLKKIQIHGDTQSIQKLFKMETPYLVADTLVNSKRRFLEGRFTDSILRAYRAIEVTIQLKLLEKNVNPWNARSLSSEVINKIQNILNPIPERLALRNGVECLKALGLTFSADSELKEIMNIRNNSYLEHGYQSVTKESAESILLKATKICRELSQSTLENEIYRVRHLDNQYPCTSSPPKNTS